MQYRAYGFAPEVARQIVAETLGHPLEETYDVFEDQPFAAASISQEHRAHLRHEDVWVVVKVQRPGIAEIFERDLKVISWLAYFGAKMPGMAYAGFDKLSRELQNIMREEVDYRYETSNLRRMRKTLRKHKIYVPKVFVDYGGVRVIVMELIEGPLMSDYLRIERTDPTRLAAWRQENNVKPVTVGSRLMRTFFRQMFEDNLFHSDLHPGNIILLRNSRFALIDLGTVGQLDSNFSELYKREWQAITEHDYVKAADIYVLMVDSLEPVDLTKFRALFVEVCRTWEARSHLRGLSYFEKSPAGGLAQGFSALAREYKMQPSWQFLRVGRAMATADASLDSLLGEKRPSKIMSRYFRESQQRAWRRLRKTGLRRVGDLASSTAESSSYLSSWLRRRAIQFEGEQTRFSHLAAGLLRLIQIAFVVGGIVVLYKYLHQHYTGLVAGIHPHLGSWGQRVERLPAIDRETALVVLVLIILCYLAAGRARKAVGRKSVRLPDGSLDA